MAVSSWERINRYCTIKPFSICARLSPEPWLWWEKSDTSTSRSSSKPVSLLTDSQCGLTPIRPRVWLHRRTCVLNRARNACLRLILWRSVYHSVSRCIQTAWPTLCLRYCQELSTKYPASNIVFIAMGKHAQVRFAPCHIQPCIHVWNCGQYAPDTWRDNLWHSQRSMDANHVLVHTPTGVERIYNRRCFSHSSSPPGAAWIHDWGRRATIEGACIMWGSHDRV